MSFRSLSTVFVFRFGANSFVGDRAIPRACGVCYVIERIMRGINGHYLSSYGRGAIQEGLLVCM